MKSKIRKSKNDTCRKTVFIIIAALTLNIYFLIVTWNNIKNESIAKTLELSRSISALLPTSHMSSLVYDSINQEFSEDSRISVQLTRLVENTKDINYAFLLGFREEEAFILSESDTKCPGGHLHNDVDYAFLNGKTEVISKKSHDKNVTFNTTLEPFYDNETGKIIAVFGICYSIDMWNRNLFEYMLFPMVIAFLFMLLAIVFSKLWCEHDLLKESERSKSVFLSHIPGMAYRCKYDKEWTMEFVSDGCINLTGYNPESLIDNKDISFSNIISPEYRQTIWEEWTMVLSKRKSFQREYEINTKTGERKWVMELGQGIYNASDDVEALEGVIFDITRRKENESHINYLTERDFLTGLYNRKHMEKLKEWVESEEFLPLSILICDINGLRVINNAYGHSEGDRLIVETSKLIKSVCRKKDILGRIGGGEFMLLLPETSDEEAYKIKEKIHKTISAYNRIKTNTEYEISTTIGYGTKNNISQSFESVLNIAEEFLERRKLLNQQSSHHNIISSIMSTMYAKSQETKEHGERIANISQAVGRHINLSLKDIDDLYLLAMLHDIGKIGVDDRILNKPGCLTDDEWVKMKQHPEIGYRIAMSSPQLQSIAEYILHHHEWWDGTGYPAGLKENEIPLVSRILSVVDAYDAMTKDRVYRAALDRDEAIKELKLYAGRQFDPDIVAVLLQLIDEGIV